MTEPETSKRPYYGLLAAHGVSLAGNTVSQLAIPWFVLETTGSAARTGVASFAGLAPLVLSAFIGGTVVDRLGHKRASIVADLASALAVAAIPILYQLDLLTFPLLLVLVALGAVLDAPGAAARRALIPAINQITGTAPERANAAFESIGGIASLAGPPVAGLTIAWLGPSNALWLNVVSFVVAAVITFALVPAAEIENPEQPFGRALVEGFRFLWHDRLIRTIVLFALPLNMVTAPLFSVVMPIVIREKTGDAADLGLLIGLVGGGSIVGAIGYGRFGMGRSRRKMVLGGLLGFSFALVVFAIRPPYAVLLAAGLGLGISLGPVNPVISTVLQARTPPALRGRTFGTVTAIALGGAPIGVLTAGLLIEAAGVGWTMTIIAVIFLIVTLAGFTSRTLIAMDSVTEAPSP